MQVCYDYNQFLSVKFVKKGSRKANVKHKLLMRTLHSKDQVLFTSSGGITLYISNKKLVKILILSVMLPYVTHIYNIFFNMMEKKFYPSTSVFP